MCQVIYTFSDMVRQPIVNFAGEDKLLTDNNYLIRVGLSNTWLSFD